MIAEIVEKIEESTFLVAKQCGGHSSDSNTL
jgi:hypothetical protein